MAVGESQFQNSSIRGCRKSVPPMWKLAFGAPFFDAPYGHISLYALGANQKPFAYERDYSRFETSVTQEAAQSGYRLESKLTISPGKDARYCLEFAHSGGKPRSLLRCAIEDNNTILFYEGDSILPMSSRCFEECLTSERADLKPGKSGGGIPGTHPIFHPSWRP